MPSLPPSPCRKPGCSKTTTDSSGYCDEHKSTDASWSRWQRDRGNRHKRGYGSKWDKLRLIVLNRDLHLCQECLRIGETAEAKTVDHIVPKSGGGTDDMSNLESLCWPCHRRKTARESRGGVG